MKQYFIVKGTKVWANDRCEFKIPIYNFSLLIRNHPTMVMPTTGEKIPINLYGPKQWFRTKKVAIAYCQFLIEKQALELAKKAEKVKLSKVTLIDTTNGQKHIY